MFKKIKENLNLGDDLDHQSVISVLQDKAKCEIVKNLIPQLNILKGLLDVDDTITSITTCPPGLIWGIQNATVFLNYYNQIEAYEEKIKDFLPSKEGGFKITPDKTKKSIEFSSFLLDKLVENVTTVEDQKEVPTTGAPWTTILGSLNI